MDTRYVILAIILIVIGLYLMSPSRSKPGVEMMAIPAGNISVTSPAVFLNTIHTEMISVATEKINNLLSKPYHLAGKCTLDFSNMDPVGCFGLIESGGYTGGKFVQYTAGAACYAACLALEPWKTAKEACCKLPGKLNCGECPTTKCKNNCDKLISWNAELKNIRGFDSVIIKDLYTLSFTPRSNNMLDTVIRCVFEIPHTVTATAHASIGGDVTQFIGVVLPTSIDADASVVNPAFYSDITLTWTCSNTSLSLNGTKVGNLTLDSGSVSLHIENNSFEPFVVIGDLFVNQILKMFQKSWTSLFSSKVLPLLQTILTNQVKSVVKLSIPIPCTAFESVVAHPI